MKYRLRKSTATHLDSALLNQGGVLLCFLCFLAFVIRSKVIIMHIICILIICFTSCASFSVEPGVGLREIAESPVMMTDVKTKALYLQRVIRDDANRVSLLIINPFGTKPISGASALILIDGLMCVHVVVTNVAGIDEQPVYTLDATNMRANKKGGADEPISIVEITGMRPNRVEIAVGPDLVVLKLRLPSGGGYPEIECELAEVGGHKGDTPNAVRLRMVRFP